MAPLYILNFKAAELVKLHKKKPLSLAINLTIPHGHCLQAVSVAK